MNSEIKRIKADLDRVNSRNAHLQMQLVDTLLGEVMEYVQDIAEAKKMAKDLSNIQRSLKQTSDAPEDAEEKRELESALVSAREAAKHIDEKKKNLRDMQRSVEKLRIEINRAIAA